MRKYVHENSKYNVESGEIQSLQISELLTEVIFLYSACIFSFLLKAFFFTFANKINCKIQIVTGKYYNYHIDMSQTKAAVSNPV